MNKKIIAFGAFLTGLAVVFGAFGAHALKATLTANQKLEVYQTAVDYHFIHSIALIALGIIAELKLISSAKLSAGFFTIGLVLFSGSLYILSLSGIGIFGAITPLGGVALIIAWGLLVYHLLKK